MHSDYRREYIWLRIVASCVISLTAMLSSVYIHTLGCQELPELFWVCTLVAVGGVAGADIVGAIVNGKRKGGVHHEHDQSNKL